MQVLIGSTRHELTALLDRAVEVGLLTGYGGGYYAIHPALPWFFTTLFTHHHPAGDGNAAQRVERAYGRAYAALGHFYHRQVEEGRAVDLLPTLRAEESNLRRALHLARTYQLADTALGCLQSLRQLYTLTGRDVEWARLVTDIQGDYLDPATDHPRPGREDHYNIVMNYRVRIAHDRRDWPTATRLQTAATTWARERAEPYLDLAADRLDATARHHLRELAVGEQDLGRILHGQRDPACLDHYRTAHDLCERIDDTAAQAILASSLGIAYRALPALRDLDQAQYWHQRDLDLKPEHDHIGRAAAHGSLANVAYERFCDARDAGAPEAELLSHLNAAHDGHRQALDLLPGDHHDYRAAIHNQLGNVYFESGDVQRALQHYQQSIAHEEARGNTYGAAQTHYNIAVLLADAGRPGDALHYAHAALDNFRAVGPGASDDITKAEQLVDELEAEIGAAGTARPSE